MADSGTMIVVGATGTVGRLLVAELLTDTRCERLMVLARKPTGLQHEKLVEHVVDFDAPDTWPPLRGEVLFSALGTTLKAAGSEEALYRIDHDVQVRVAVAAVRGGVQTHVLVSSNAANLRSPTFYGRMKAEVERDIGELQFKKICILRPGVLEGNHAAERATSADPATRPLPGATLARAAIAAAYADDPFSRPRRSGPSDLMRLAGAAPTAS